MSCNLLLGGDPVGGMTTVDSTTEMWPALLLAEVSFNKRPDDELLLVVIIDVRMVSNSPSFELKEELCCDAMAMDPPSVAVAGWSWWSLRVCFLRSKLRQNPFPQMRQVNCDA